ncbi:MAG: molybdopterin-dependent oxidoreductase [Armatimonadetes bacterium]|nr:molybdopterin-dependent oxidoreductase [Armatimonadota bacterium]MDW8153286.1 molybdopterin-dependent oxidoreductase [Armatimonadota bacterium]
MGPTFRLTRREFLASLPAAAAALAGLELPDELLSFSVLQPLEPGTNPLQKYPNRDWEKVYRELYTPELTFHYLCAPNDTHGCLLRASVKNGVVVYADPSFGYGKATDLYGNQASARWDPRICISGLAYVRRFYSDRRVKGPMVRKGFKEWVDAGFPRDPETGAPPAGYFEGRGKEEFVRVSWDEAFTYVAKALLNIAQTYSGEVGRQRLLRQGYDPDMVEAMEGAGTRTLKFRGGMPFIAPFRTGGLYRMANMVALLDAYVRKVGPEEAKGGRGWDNYAWHTDLPPGHPMVTGQQTLDFDLYTAENARLILLWGKNWIATKMPDGHWLTEAKLHGARVVTIAPEYQSSSSKADEVIVIRPGTDPAFALGLAQVLLRERLYDEDFVKQFTDLPLLVRMDTLKELRARDVFSDHRPAPLRNGTRVLQPGEPIPPPAEQEAQLIPQALREEWDDFVVWDRRTNSPKPVTRDQVGRHFAATGLDPALEGEFQVTLRDGRRVAVRPVFDLLKQYLLDTWTPENASRITGAPPQAVVNLARQIAQNKAKTLFVTGMGPNHFFNADLKDRAIILVAALSNNVGHFGGTVGSYAGNYRLALLPGIVQYIHEDPFHPELDPDRAARVRAYWRGESAHFFNYDDRPLRVGRKQFTGKTHMPTPTKAALWANTNSILGNAKWAYNLVVNTLPKVEMVVVADWFWTATCEYADVVFAVDSWVERKLHDVYAAVTNPFLQAWPPSPLPRLFDTRDDLECWAGVAGKLAELTGDRRFRDYWHFVLTGKPEVYIDRVFRAGNTTRGYTYRQLLESCRNGTPLYLLTRTSPRVVGWEQTQESKPWYTKTGRLEFYREEDEFLEHGENLPVHREPVDGTHHEPNVIVAKPHPALRPAPPEAYGLRTEDLRTEVRQVRNVIRSPEEVVASRHPLRKIGYTHVLITPKYRHACHSTGASTDLDVVFWGPFGDFYRHDRRKPWVSEGYIDLNPEDARRLGIADGDYVWCEADPQDRPFVGYERRPEERRIFRWLVRARYYPSIMQGTGRAWFHFYVATHGSVEGHEKRRDGLAKNPRTNYQAAYRYGSHQSVTRAWLRPTLLTDSLVRKETIGQVLATGFSLDVHGAIGAPKESYVRIRRAESGGEDGKGLWAPAAQGFRPRFESEAVRRYLAGEFIVLKRR